MAGHIRRQTRQIRRLGARLSPEPKLNVTNLDPKPFGSAGVSGQKGATIAEVRGGDVHDRDKEGMIRKGMKTTVTNRSGHTDGGT